MESSTGTPGPAKIVVTATQRVTTVSAKSQSRNQAVEPVNTPAVVGQARTEPLSQTQQQHQQPSLLQADTTLISEANEQQANYIKEKSSVAIANEATGPRIDYKNGRKVEPVLVSYNNYFLHREKLPQHYHPLVQYLEKTELKYHNDNLYENSPIGFPTRAQILREKVYHLPIIKSTPAEKARYKRKKEEKQAQIIAARKKYDFKTYDNYSSHYFLTGGRFNRNDTIDSKVLNRYGIFVNRHNPESVYINSVDRAVQSYHEDQNNMRLFASMQIREESIFQNKAVQVPPAASSSIKS